MASGDVRLVRDSSSETEDQEDPVKCVLCSSSGRSRRLILCEGVREGQPCGGSYHAFCLGLAAVPEGTWLCPECAPATVDLTN